MHQASLTYAWTVVVIHLGVLGPLEIILGFLVGLGWFSATLRSSGDIEGVGIQIP